MSKPPVEIPLGAMRFNSDSQKLEYFNGDVWMQVDTFNPDLNGGGRGQNMAGSNYTQTIDYITISTAGDAIDFGDLIKRCMLVSGGSNSTRSVVYGGREHPGSNQINRIEYVTFSSTGNATDFGDLRKINNYGAIGNLGNETRGMIAAGINYSPATDMDEDIDYITYASTGNAIEFGETASNHSDGPAAFSSSTRGVVAGGSGAGNVMEYVTIATTGNAQDFGDLNNATQGPAGAANSVVGLIGNGYVSADIDTIDKVIMATTGNATEFGNSTDSRRWPGGMASSTRAVWTGGYAPGIVDTIDYVEIATGGDAVDFGDMSYSSGGHTSNSNCHGGCG